MRAFLNHRLRLPFRGLHLLILAAVLGLAACAGPERARVNQPEPEPPRAGPYVPLQTRPVYDMIRAVDASDPELLSTVFSSEVRQGFVEDGMDWTEVLALYRDFLQQGIGPFELEDFAFSYVGDSEAGRAVIIYRGERKGDMAVVLENGQWRLDER